ncbi:cytochrome c family protein [Fervidibacter sacchari]|uniref:Nitrate/TMAO reductase-like tetraheme cytochrome c subunit n=1 Tax=Candidatus Fervidibacter sacchari TaxID=1448929 RepID=A0ABT2EKF7_9BACT|nr:cytochrome c family protein [Candidatus Fervidibacter sacchari]MCS3918437.1 nitrate/TMAO reductase-like tetraheme cytochrome c subunit [Candidatus Fervidibacter sacchari]WKU16220.1 cytochrome c family protein [Candidatus Fervidibacter sacchari]
MTQRSAQERLSRLGMIGTVVLALLFVGITLRLWRTSAPPPPKIELPQEPPDLVLLVTANRQGKLEVCGCPGKRAEDLAKVATLLQDLTNEMQQKGATVSVIEGGDFTGGSDVVPYILRAYKVVGYQCIVLSPRDEKRLSVIRTNADGMQLLVPANPENLQTFQVSGKTFSITLVNLGQPPLKDESYWQRLLPRLKALKQPNNLLAAVAFTDRNSAMELAPHLKGTVNILMIDDALPLTNGEFSPGMTKASKEVSGVTLVALPQSRSTVLSLMVWTNSQSRDSYRVEGQWVNAAGRNDDPQVKKIVDEYYEKRQKELEREMKELMKIASQRHYLPPEFCGGCHQAQYEQWLNTGHAHAIETLVNQKRMDKSCLTCHSLEFRMRGVVTEVKKRGVECVDCHVELQDPATAKMHGQRPGERPTTRIVNETVCVSCHDKQNSPNFNLQTYLPKVVH